VHQLNAELARICNPLFRRLQVDLITSRILVMLWEYGDVYIGDIVETMALPQSTVSHQLKRLEEAGFVRRRADQSDSRAFVVSLTRRGKEVAKRCNQISTQIYAQLFPDVEETQMQQLVAGLETMARRLKTMSAANLEFDSTKIKT
jgi:MarR family transcriptional regulator, organic hydroperoxide resistance regulator